MLAGGGALPGVLDRLLANETGLPVFVAEDPLTWVVRASGTAPERMDKFGSVFSCDESRCLVAMRRSPRPPHLVNLCFRMPRRLTHARHRCCGMERVSRSRPSNCCFPSSRRFVASRSVACRLRRGTYSFLDKKRSCGASRGYGSSQSCIWGNVARGDHATARCVEG
jgi:hypothetical protein